MLKASQVYSKSNHFGNDAEGIVCLSMPKYKCINQFQSIPEIVDLVKI